MISYDTGTSLGEITDISRNTSELVNSEPLPTISYAFSSEVTVYPIWLMRPVLVLEVGGKSEKKLNIF